MKYLIRSVKYLLFVMILFGIMLAILLLTSPKGTTIDALFVPGALPKIALFFVAIAAIYPMFGYVKKEAFLNKKYEDVEDTINDVFSQAGYEVVSEDSDKMIYRSKKLPVRLMRLYEDHIILNKTGDQIVLEGGRKDVYRLIRSIEYRVNREEE